MALVNSQDDSVSVLLLRLHKREILIPKAMVADVLSWRQALFSTVKATDSKSRLGEVLWNDEPIPLICFESLMDADSGEQTMLKRKLVIVKACQKDFQNQHYAIQCRGFPKPLIISRQPLDGLDVKDDQAWIAYSICIGSRVLDIPQFAALENAIWDMPLPVSHSA